MTAAKLALFDEVAIDLPAGTPVRLSGHQAVVARPAGLMDVVEGDDVPGSQWIAQGVSVDARGLQDPPDAHMARDDGVGHSRELAVKKMDIRAANLTGNGLQKDGTRFQNRVVQLPYLHWGVGSDHDCGSYTHTGKVEERPSSG